MLSIAAQHCGGPYAAHDPSFTAEYHGWQPDVRLSVSAKVGTISNLRISNTYLSFLLS